MAKKKTAKKKATTPKKKVARAIVATGFDPSTDDGQTILLQGRDLLIENNLRRKNRPADFLTMGAVQQQSAWVEDFPLQYVLGRTGIPKPGLIEIIARRGLGKSTLAALLCGYLMRHEKSPVLWLEAEGKPIDKSRVRRCMSTDPALAQKMVDCIIYKRVRLLSEFEDVYLNFARIFRGKKDVYGKSVHIPDDIPLVVVLDPFSKLMHESEASGLLDYASDVSSDGDIKPTGEGSANPRHAKWASEFSRKLAAMQDEYNIVFIMIHHQTDKVNMDGGKGGGHQLAEGIAGLYNSNKLGGQAFDQNASAILLLDRGAMVKDGSGRSRGKTITCRIDKHSYGPGSRKVSWELREEHGAYDLPDYLDPALHFEAEWAKWMAENRLMGTTVDRQRFTCQALGLSGVTAEEFYRAFHANPEARKNLGTELRIEGYDDIIDRILEAKSVYDELPPTLDIES